MISSRVWMRSSRVVNEIYTEWLEHLAVNAKVAAVLGLILATSDTVESEGRQRKQC
jgi:hypothetical protein